MEKIQQFGTPRYCDLLVELERYLQEHIEYIDVIPDIIDQCGLMKQKSFEGIEMIIPANVVSGYKGKEPYITFGKYINLEQTPNYPFRCYFSVHANNVYFSKLCVCLPKYDKDYDKFNSLYTNVIEHQMVNNPNGLVAKLRNHMRDCATHDVLVLDASKVPSIMQEWLKQQFCIKK